MLRDITLGQYYPGKSRIHKMDSRIKILITLLYIVLLFLVQNFSGFIAFAIFTASVVYVTKIPLSYIFKGLKPLLFIIALTAVLNIFMTGGRTAFTIPYTSITATWEGISLAAFMIIRLTFLITGTSLLTLTTSPIALTDGIEQLLSPLKKIKFPAHEIAMMMTIAIRFIPTLLEETEKIMKAQTSRGADFESGNIIKRAKALVPLLVPLFISAFRRADELAMAMECRCYNGGAGRTRMNVLKINSNDILCASVAVASLALASAIGYMTFLF